MRNPLSKRIVEIEPSGIRKFFDIVNEMEDAISLGVGEPDFDTPWHIRDEGIFSLEKGRTFYTSNAGLKELKQEIAKYIYRKCNITYDYKKEIMVTVGGSEAIDIAMRAMLDPGDEVLIPQPSYVSYEPCAILANGTPVVIELKEENEFRLTKEELEAAITPKTKLLVLPFPNNPTGAVMERKDLEEIAEVIKEHDIFVLSDEIYAELTYCGEHVSIASLPGMKERTVLINGFSKAYAMTGWRIGFAVGDEKIIQAMTQLASQSTSNPVAVSQYAAIEALTGEQSTVEDMRQAFEKRLNHIYPKVAALPGVSLIKPEGAFYLFPNVKKTLEICGYDNVTNWVEDLLQEAHVALVTGEGFGAPEHVRMSYATDLMTLEKAIERMNDFIEKKRIQHNA